MGWSWAGEFGEGVGFAVEGELLSERGEFFERVAGFAVGEVFGGAGDDGECCGLTDGVEKFASAGVEGEGADVERSFVVGGADGFCCQVQ